MVRYFFIPKLVLFAFVMLVGTHGANGQSTAAMQVCADILAQYGIAPEGCDPQDEVYSKSKKENTPQTQETVETTSLSQMELDENNVFFRQGGDKLDQTARAKLDTLSTLLNTSYLNTACLRLVGHSDASGPSNLNIEMGLKRANVVAQYLRPKLNDATRIQEILSDGEDNLIPGIDAANALHRRVTFYARQCPQP